MCVCVCEDVVRRGQRRSITVMGRTLPNILVTGTPGTGKSTMVQSLVARVPTLHSIDVGALVRDKQLHSGWDEEYQTYVLDEDKVCKPLRAGSSRADRSKHRCCYCSPADPRDGVCSCWTRWRRRWKPAELWSSTMEPSCFQSAGST